MFGFKKSIPIIFFCLALSLLFIPAKWLNPAELFVLTAFTPLGYLFPHKTQSKLPLDSSTSTEMAPADKISQLQQEINKLKTELTQVYNDNRELTEKLNKVTQFIATQPNAREVHKYYDIIVADVIIQRDASLWRRSLVINQGSNSGIQTGLPVISGKHMVGKISGVGPLTSRVQLITDPTFRAKAFAIPVPKKDKEKETRKKKRRLKKISGLQRGEGVLEGYSTSQCSLKWVSRDIKVKSGWTVLSSTDLKGIWPKGLIVGAVTDVREEGYFYRLKIKPAVDFNNLESVLILKRKGTK